MSVDRRVRRCGALFLQPVERRRLDFSALLTGADAVRIEQVWLAFAPHLDSPIELDATAVSALGRISDSRWMPHAETASDVGDDNLRALIEFGLVLADDTLSPLRLCDESQRTLQWHPLAAAAHRFSRWSAIDSLAVQRESRIQSTADLIAEHGRPPPQYHIRDDSQERTALPRPPPNELDTLLMRRATCRNFDSTAPLTQAMLGALLYRVFGVHGSEELETGAVALKKNHPSGGGLHPLEAYLIVQRAENLRAGLYHYNVETHALDLLREMSTGEASALALTAVAGQDYFAEAPALAVITARFARSFWKYRNHPKIYRAILLEAGHASQNLYLAATELGLGAFVTAAINEVDIEQAFGFDPMHEGVLAVCGFGARTTHRQTIELDPQQRIWSAAGKRV